MKKKEQEFIKEMIRLRGIDFARLGMMVEVRGDPGTIKGINNSANLDVVFANQLKRKGKQNCHPTYDIKYFDGDGKLIKEYGRD